MDSSEGEIGSWAMTNAGRCLEREQEANNQRRYIEQVRKHLDIDNPSSVDYLMA